MGRIAGLTMVGNGICCLTRKWERFAEHLWSIRGALLEHARSMQGALLGCRASDVGMMWRRVGGCRGEGVKKVRAASQRPALVKLITKHTYQLINEKLFSVSVLYYGGERGKVA